MGEAEKAVTSCYRFNFMLPIQRVFRVFFFPTERHLFRFFRKIIQKNEKQSGEIVSCYRFKGYFKFSSSLRSGLFPLFRKNDRKTGKQNA